jgi:hypothetical protein
MRSENIDFLTFLSNLAGSIIGLIGTTGFLMNIYEAKVEEFMFKRSLRQNLRKVGDYRRNLLLLNFGQQVKKRKISKVLYSTENHSIEQPVLDTCRVSSHERDSMENEILPNRVLVPFYAQTSDSQYLYKNKE